VASKHHEEEHPRLVTDEDALAQLTARLALVGRIAFDTEAASFHRYVDRVYLIQLSSDSETALIDPLEITNLEPIGAILEDPRVEVVFHDADYDLRVLNRDYGFRARNLFDTRLAAQLAGEEAVGLGALLEKYVDVKLDKRFQRADWSQRPLSEEMVAYAASDTRHLLRLRDILAERLEELARLHWAEEEFLRLENLRWTGGVKDEESHLRIKGAKGLPPRQRVILERVYAWRDATAAELDRAPFRVLGNDTMLAIARAAPETLGALSRIKGVSASIARRNGQAILSAVKQGVDCPKEALPKAPRRTRLKPDPGCVTRLERLKELRNARAESCGMDPGLVCPNGTLQAIARMAPATAAQLNDVAELRAWQRSVLGELAILEAAHSS
jgi:ribonuclease D